MLFYFLKEGGCMSDISKRILNTLNLKEVSYGELSERTGIPKSALQRYATGQTEKIPIDRLQIIANAIGVTTQFLMGWEDSSQKNAGIPAGYSPVPDTDHVPRIGRIACGDPITAEENIEDYDEVRKSWHADFTLVCCGNSMLPKIEDGDIVAIRAQSTVENGEIAAVRIGDEATLKQVFVHPGFIELRPLNSEYPSIIKSKDEMEDIHIEGIAVGLCRDL